MQVRKAERRTGAQTPLHHQTWCQYRVEGPLRLLTHSLIVLLALSVMSSSGWAKPLAPSAIASRIKAADAAFRVQDFEKTIALLKPLAASSKIKNQALKIKILERLGASHWLGGQPDAARDERVCHLWRTG